MNLWSIVHFGAIVLIFAPILAQVGEGAETQDGVKPAEQLLNLSGMQSGVNTARQVVIRDSKSFQEFWKEHTKFGPIPAPPVPAVDFKKHDVVAVFAGQKSTGGFSMQIDGVTVKGKSAVIRATLLKPPPGSLLPQIITYPFAIRGFPKLPAAVKFEIREQVRK